MSKAEEFVFVSGTQPVSTSENFTQLERKKIEININWPRLMQTGVE